MKEWVHIACPCCKNKRLFDADPEAVEGIIRIKCPICKSVIAVSFHRKKVRTERIGVWAIITTRAWRSIDVKRHLYFVRLFFCAIYKNGTISFLKGEEVNRQAGKVLKIRLITKIEILTRTGISRCRFWWVSQNTFFCIFFWQKYPVSPQLDSTAILEF